MGAQKGKDFLLKLRDSAGNYITIAGLRTRQMVFNAETVDVTHTESAGRWRELLAGAGVQRASIAGSGVFKDAASDGELRRHFFEGQHADCQIVVPDFGTLEGLFQITALEYAGDHAAEVTFDIALESAGALTFVLLP